MKIYEYKDYNEYVENQTKANKQKIGWKFVRPHAIKSIADDRGAKEVNFIICHGTRNGAEQKMFKEHFPNADVIGTEISDTASQFEMTIQHDFAVQRQEWIGKADLVYSNSFDHSIDPVKTIQTWRDQLAENGTLYIEYNERLSVCEPVDCLDATTSEMEDLITSNGLRIRTKFKGSQGSDVLVCEI